MSAPVAVAVAVAAQAEVKEAVDGTKQKAEVVVQSVQMDVSEEEEDEEEKEEEEEELSHGERLQALIVNYIAEKRVTFASILTALATADLTLADTEMYVRDRMMQHLKAILGCNIKKPHVCCASTADSVRRSVVCQQLMAFEVWTHCLPQDVSYCLSHSCYQHIIAHPSLTIVI